jgi:hypothetical protein
VLLASAIVLGASIAWRLAQAPASPLPPAIGKLIRLLLPIQAAFCMHAGAFGVIVAVLLLALWPLSRAVSKRFYAS